MTGNKIRSNKKGQYIVCTKSELLEEVTKVVGKMWNSCRPCNYCFICKKILVCFK